jgi:outer membrane receptor protein involved in Fe transport
MKAVRWMSLVALVLLVTSAALGQGQITGNLTGTVTSGGVPLPGVTVTVSSPNLQGTRDTVTDASGNYNFVGLPPGRYSVTMELEGLQTANRTAQVTLSGTARADAELNVSAVTEAITVTASAPAVVETTEVQSNFQQEDINQLPVGRNPVAIANLAPGVTNNGPGNAMIISGGMSYDNLILVDGSTIQDNVRGTARPLYIEDAIQETTVLTGAVSAEFGNFTGGVVNSITRSGGNEFHGSIRDSLSNPTWTESTAFGESQGEDEIANIFEGTFGGYILKDRLWFFGAGRSSETTAAAARGPNILGTTQQIFSTSTNRRYEVKLTGQVAPSHNLVGTYLNNPLKGTNDVQIPVWEEEAIDPSIEQGEDFRSVNYSGVFTNNFMGEVNWSRRTFEFIGFGGDDPDIYGGTPLRSSFSSASLNGIANAPWFCGVCDTESRDTERTTAKLTYFHGTKGLGTHNIIGGAERYTELMVSNNWQSASGMTVWMYNTPPVRQSNGQVLFTWGPGDSVESFRVDNPSLGSDLTSNSFFVNDKWDLNRNFSFNLGLRYDNTQANDQAGNPTADESSFSPRLGVTYDPTGRGRFRLGATYGRFVGRLAEGVQGAGSNAGDPNWYGWYAPEGTPTFTGTSAEVVRYAIDWWLANGGFNLQQNPPTDVSIGGVSTQLQGSIAAPGMNEWTIGAGFQYSPNGYFRVDLINRDWDNFYVARTTGERVTLPGGGVADLTVVGNSDQLERHYRGIQLQANQRLFNRFNLGGSYTLSKLEGNAEAEGTSAGPSTTGGWIFQYPEYQGFEQNLPVGYLSADQRHKLRAWVSYDQPLGPIGTLNFSLLQRFDSGTPYSVVGTLARPTPTSPVSYVSPPQTVQYYFSNRGERRWDDVSRTDLAVNWELPIRGVGLFIETEVLNVFNQQQQIGGATTVITSRNTTPACGGGTVRCQAFNPFTDTPVEGVNYALLTPDVAATLRSRGFTIPESQVFGSPISSSSYQLPRTYQLSLGVRF